MRKHDKDTMIRLYDDWTGSGLSMKAFSLANNINPATFNYWVKSIKKERHQSCSPGFVRLPVPKSVTGGSIVATITFPSGARVDVYQPACTQFIKELVG